MRWILLVLLISLFSSPSVRAQGDDCPSSASVKITVTPVVANPVYDFSAGIPEIQSMANIIVHQVRQGWALGFTRTEPLLEMDAPVVTTPAGEGRFCAAPRYINIAVGYRDQTIFIPREIPGESCGLSEVIEHEQKHLAANRALAEKYAALIKAKFTDYVRTSTTLPQANTEDAALIEQNMLRGLLDDAAMKMIAENATWQQDIDSADEYHRLLTVCGGQLAAVVMDAREQPRVAENFSNYARVGLQ